MSNIRVIGSKTLRIGGTDFGKILSVALWSGLSAGAAVLMQQLGAVNWNEVFGNPQYAAFAVTLLNVVAYAIKQFLKDTREEVVDAV